MCAPVIFFPPQLISSGEEGGSSDAAAVVNLLGRVRRRKPGIKTKAVLKGRGKSGPESVSEADLRRAYRGQTDGRTDGGDMEGTTEEEYKEKLLWNVKREVGAAV